MKKIRLSIIASSLILCAWLTASFTTKNQPTSPLTTPASSAQSTEEDSPSTKAGVKTSTDQKNRKDAEITAPVARIK